MSREPRQSILFIRLRSLGDTVLMTPALQVARRAGMHTAALVEEPFAALLKGHPHLHELLVMPSQGWAWANRLRMLRRLRRLSFDLVVDLHGGSTAALLTRFSGARRRVGYASARFKDWYDVKTPDSRQLWNNRPVHTVEHQLSPLLHLGLPVEPIPQLHLPVDEGALAYVEQLLTASGFSDRSFALIHPAAAFDTKQWAARHFAEIGDRLQERFKLPVAVTAGPGEKVLVEEVGALMKRRPLLIEPLPLDRFAALVSRCALYLGNDSGPMHMAAAFKRPVVAVFGSSDWRVWRPWNTPHRLIKADLPCIPCPGYTCHLYDQPRCIRSIGVDQVWQAVEELADTI
ncbi:MAG TPA: glycosyltransferase family 9 protein [Acidobacteriota bacterium]|nr:glycosyltransferase family 9 protein [Acidobacteriota bacterium]